MIRDRLKRAAHRVAVKVLKMEFDVEDRDPNAQTKGDPSTYDESKIPKLVDGDGDTPGPKHKYDIGRTWTAAQIVSGVQGWFIDIRPPRECAAGMLQGAMVLPGEAVKQHLDRLPPKDVRVTVYDQTGELGSAAVAEWLREQGWVLARRLQGGYAEWIEHGEPIEVPVAPPGAAFKIGDPVRLKGGGDGWVARVGQDGGGLRYQIWTEAGGLSGPLGADQLES
jgi:rhodanese-related sulfurtransferase